MKEAPNHELIGKRYEDVENKEKIRVKREDDMLFVLTEDYLIRRINVEIDNGIITKVYFG